jgi:quercetin dioxygenase-like cupin family protein
METRTSAIVDAGAGERLDVLTDVVTVKTGSPTGALEIFEVCGPAESGPPPHDHPWTEYFYVLEGEIDVAVGEEERRVGAGDLVHIPAGTTHAFAVASPTARFLAITEGDRAGRLFRELSTLGAVVPDEAHLPAIVTIAKRNGLRSPLFPA